VAHNGSEVLKREPIVKHQRLEWPLRQKLTQRPHGGTCGVESACGDLKRAIRGCGAHPL